MKSWTQKDQRRATHFGWGVLLPVPPQISKPSIYNNGGFKNTKAARKHVLDFAFGEYEERGPVENIWEEVLLCRKAITHIILNQ